MDCADVNEAAAVFVPGLNVAGEESDDAAPVSAAAAVFVPGANVAAAASVDAPPVSATAVVNVAATGTIGTLPAANDSLANELSPNIAQPIQS